MGIQDSFFPITARVTERRCPSFEWLGKRWKAETRQGITGNTQIFTAFTEIV